MNISILPSRRFWTKPCSAEEERVSPPKRVFRPIALGIWENTYMTVTYREVLFILLSPF